MVKKWDVFIGEEILFGLSIINMESSLPSQLEVTSGSSETYAQDA
jgi:hypothetical protein